MLGAAVFARPVAASCSGSAPLQLLVREASVIVVADVSSASAGNATLQPEAFLKGAATADPITLRNPDPANDCMAPDFVAGERVLAIIAPAAAAGRWPTAAGLYRLSGGQAINRGGLPQVTEAELINEIRQQTNEYAVPARTRSEGAGINLAKTVLPVGAALILIFGIGLYLMKSWHRIDPS